MSLATWCLLFFPVGMAACKPTGPDLNTTSEGEVYLVQDGTVFHLQGSRAISVTFNRPPVDSVKEFTDTIRGLDWAIQTHLTLKYFGPSDVRYLLKLSILDAPGEEETTCWREADSFLTITVDDSHEFRITSIRQGQYGLFQRSILMSSLAFNYPRLLCWPRPSDTLLDPDSVDAEIAHRAEPLKQFVAARGQLRLSAQDFERMASSRARTTICPEAR